MITLSSCMSLPARAVTESDGETFVFRSGMRAQNSVLAERGTWRVTVQVSRPFSNTAEILTLCVTRQFSNRSVSPHFHRAARFFVTSHDATYGCPLVRACSRAYKLVFVVVQKRVQYSTFIYEDLSVNSWAAL